MKLMKKGIEYFQVHKHDYNIDFFSFKRLSITMKNYSSTIKTLNSNLMCTIKWQWK
jgi:hypothetical protein